MATDVMSFGELVCVNNVGYNIVQPVATADNTYVGDNLYGYWWNNQWWYGYGHQTCGCHCMHCFLALVAALKLTPAICAAPAITSSSVADAILKQVRARIDEIQRKLDEVPALTSELEKLKKIAEAGG